MRPEASGTEAAGEDYQTAPRACKEKIRKAKAPNEKETALKVKRNHRENFPSV